MTNDFGVRPHDDARLPELAGDAAQNRIEDDEFGFGEIVRSIAQVVRSRVAADGYAIGIEGRWGSGKTTLLNFLDHALRHDADAYQKVIRFDPWLAGDKAGMLRGVLSDLSKAIREFSGDARVRNIIKREDKSLLARLDQLASTVDQYSNYVELASRGAKFAAKIDPSLYTKLISWILSAGLSIAKFVKRAPPSLDQLKAEISNDLRAIKNLIPGACISVLIDDTDRLEPSESVEVLRLIKAVANFPLIVYVVCFDMPVLSAQVASVMLGANGEGYLEKIFQQIVPIPPQEPFALRRFVQRHLDSAFPEEFDRDETDIRFQERQNVVFDRWIGKLIQTPRDAIRLIENVKFGWPYLEGRADFLDFVWLQLVKLQCRGLYEWTQSYVTSIGAYRDGGRPGDAEPEAEAQRLKTILESIGFAGPLYQNGLDIVLPGLRAMDHPLSSNDDQGKVFKFEDEELSQFESARRLGSPSHWRLFFAFDKPSYALDDAEFRAFRRAAAQDSKKGAEILTSLAERPHATDGYHLDVFLERLAQEKSEFSPEEDRGIAESFAECMDSIGSVDYAVGIDPWRRSFRLLGPYAASKFADLCQHGQAICWLAAALRDQAFAFGLLDSSDTSPDRLWLSRDEFDSAVAVLQARFDEMRFRQILDGPEAAHSLLFLLQVGDREKLKERMDTSLKDDMMFLRFLLRLRSSVRSSDRGTYKAIHREMVALFLDYEAVLKRVKALAEGGSSGTGVQPTAVGVLNALEASKRRL